MNPASQGAVSVDLNCGYILEKEMEVFDHEVFSRRLWAPHTAFMVATCGDHVAQGAVEWSAYHFADKVHLSHGNHVADTRDGVEQFPHFVIVELLFADLGH